MDFGEVPTIVTTDGMARNDGARREVISSMESSEFCSSSFTTLPGNAQQATDIQFPRLEPCDDESLVRFPRDG